MAALTKAEKIRNNIEKLKIVHEVSKVNKYVTVSTGINTMTVTQGDSVQEFVNKADEALYRAKDKGRNCSIHVKDL